MRTHNCFLLPPKANPAKVPNPPNAKSPTSVQPAFASTPCLVSDSIFSISKILFFKSYLSILKNPFHSLKVAVLKPIAIPHFLGFIPIPPITFIITSPIIFQRPLISHFRFVQRYEEFHKS